MHYPTKKLGEIAEVGAGNSAPQDKKYFSNGSVPFFRTADVGRVHFSTDLNNTGDLLNEKAIKELGLKVWPRNTILFPKSGASTFLNHRVMIGTDGVVSSHLATIFSENEIAQKYIFYFLTTIDARSLTANQSYPSLRVSDIQKIKLPLPPLEIQKQIVERLDKIVAAQKLNDELIQKTDELFQSLLHKELNPAGKNWEKKKLGEVVTINYGKGLIKSERVDSGKYFAYGSNGPIYKTNKVLVKNPTIVIGRKGTAGAVYLVNEPSWPIDTTFYLETGAGVDLNFLVYLLQIKNLPRLAIITAVPGVNRSDLNRVKLAMPPLKTQKQIAAKLSAVQNYKKQLLEQKAKLKELFESALYKSMQKL